VLQQDQPITFLFWTEDMAGVAPRCRASEMDARGKLVNVQRMVDSRRQAALSRRARRNIRRGPVHSSGTAHRARGNRGRDLGHE
jgi:hypothetical protein